MTALVSGLGAPAAGLRLCTDQVGEGYGALTPAAEAVMRAAGRTEGLLRPAGFCGHPLAGRLPAELLRRAM